MSYNRQNSKKADLFFVVARKDSFFGPGEAQPDGVSTPGTRGVDLDQQPMDSGMPYQHTWRIIPGIETS